MTRREFPVKVRKAAWDRCGGRCEKCGRAITCRAGDGPNYDHEIPDALGGQPTLDNCKVLCIPCHSAKTTAEDVPRIAKAKRIEAELMGWKAAKQRLPGGRWDRRKKKLDGTVVIREGR